MTAKCKGGHGILYKLSDSLSDYISSYISQYFPEGVRSNVSHTKLGIDYGAVPFQVPRLLLGPGVADIVAELDRYFYSPSQKLYVSRDLAERTDFNPNDGQKKLLI